MGETLEKKGYDARLHVSEKFKSWDVEYPSYEPIDFTDKVVFASEVQGLADPPDPREVDFSTRPSFLGDFQIDEVTGRPLNPTGRQGIAGRGRLRKWGPNNAADSVVIATDEDGNPNILLIKRKDNGNWALPGGRVDPGEEATTTARRELGEETGIDLPEEVSVREIYSGYVDDPRNTDNAWMETTAFLILVDHPLETTAGDDAAEAAWFNITNIDDLLTQIDGMMHANHAAIVQKALDELTMSPAC